MHVPLTRNAQTSDRPVEVQWSIIGERSEPPLSVELSEFSLYLYIYIIIYLFIYIFQVVRRARAVNALRANVGPAG